MNSTTFPATTFPALAPTFAPAEKALTDSWPGLDDLLYPVEELPPLLPSDLSELPTAELKRLCNLAFREMDSDFPRLGASDDYDTLLEELRSRATA